MSVLCPKCGFESTDEEMCDACGVIFARLGPGATPPASTGKSSASDPYDDDDEDRSGVLRYLLIGLAVISVIGIVYYWRVVIPDMGAMAERSKTAAALAEDDVITTAPLRAKLQETAQPTAEEQKRQAEREEMRKRAYKEAGGQGMTGAVDKEREQKIQETLDELKKPPAQTPAPR